MTCPKCGGKMHISRGTINLNFKFIHGPSYECKCGEVYIRKQVVKETIKKSCEDMYRIETLWVIANGLKLSNKQVYRLIKIGQLNAIKKKERWFIYMDYKLKKFTGKMGE